MQSIPHKTTFGLLILANLFVIIEFLLFGGSIAQVLWIYFLQSLIIGAVNVWRILSVPSSTIALPIRLLGALFFVSHYGFFHLIYAIFLFVMTASNAPFTTNGVETDGEQLFSGTIQLGGLVITTILFGIHHVVSFLQERKQWKAQNMQLDSVLNMMSKPYARIFPLHLIILFGPFISLALGSTAVFLVFIILKTIADIILHQKGTSHISQTERSPSPSV